MLLSIASLILFILSVAILYCLDPLLLTTAWQLLHSNDPEALVTFLRSYGSWAIVISLVLNTLVNLSGILPTVLISGANALIFGLYSGIIISWTAEVIGAGISFFLFRGLLRPLARRWIRKNGKLLALDDFSARRGFRAVFLARLLPFSPSGAINIIAAVSSLSSRNFLLATALGKIPAIIFEVLVGYNLLAHGTSTAVLFSTVLLLITAALYSYWRNRQPPRL